MTLSTDLLVAHQFDGEGEPQNDLSVVDGYDPDVVLAQHLVHDCDKPTFWALSVLAAAGRL